MKILITLFAICVFSSPATSQNQERVWSPGVTVNKIKTNTALNGAMRFQGEIIGDHAKKKKHHGKVLIYVNAVLIDSTTTGRFKFTLKKEIETPVRITFRASMSKNLSLEVEAFKANVDYDCLVNFQEQILKEAEKPVVYFYAKEDIEVTAKLKVNGKIGFTYPTIKNNEWVFSLKDRNQIKMGGKVYNYLFYDTYATPVSAGTDNAEILYVTKGNVVTFLEHKLALEGLSTQEAADFICYWAPRMIQHDNLKLHFLSGEGYEAISTMEISPKPDMFKRVFMTFEPVKYDVETSDLPAINTMSKRPDFTVIEWGGMEIKSNPIP